MRCFLKARLAVPLAVLGLCAAVLAYLYLWTGKPEPGDEAASQATVATVPDPAAIPDPEQFLATLPAEPSRDRPVYAPSVVSTDRTGALNDRLDEFLKLAENDPSTAFDLGVSISSCSGVVEDDSAVDALVEQGGSAVRVAGSILDQQEYCDGLTKDDFDRGLDLLKRAANSGLVEAQLNYANSAGAIIAGVDGYAFDADRISQYKRDAVSNLHRAAASGNADALANLSFMYEDGAIVPADPAAAARFYRAYMQRAGRNTARDQARLEQLDRAARGG